MTDTVPYLPIGALAKATGSKVETILSLPFIPSAAETLEFPSTAGYLLRHA